MNMMLKIFICFWFNQVSSLSSEFIKCYPEQSTSYLIAGKNFAIHCDFHFEGNVGPSHLSRPNKTIVTFKKNGDTFQTNNIKELINNNRLSINFLDLNQKDSGVYKCVYSDGKILEESDPMELVVLPKPSDPICTASPLESYVGDTATLVCETYSYSSLSLLWIVDSLQDLIVFNVTNKKKTSGVVTFTPSHPDIGAVFTCIMSIEEEIWMCTSTVVVRKRLSVKLSKPCFTLNQPATLLCTIESYGRREGLSSTDVDERSLIEELDSKNTTLIRNYTVSTGNLKFEWISTREVLFNDAIEQANASNKLTIQNVSDEMNGENITCTVKSNDAMGSNMITIYIDEHVVTYVSSTGVLKVTRPTGKHSGEEDNGNTIVNSSDSIHIEIIIPVTLMLVFLCQLPLVALLCLRYLKRYVDQNMQAGTLHQTIDFHNDAYDTSVPIPQPPPMDVASSDTVNLMIIPNRPTSQLPAVSNRQRDHVPVKEERPQSLYTKTNSSHSRFIEDRVPLNAKDFKNMLDIDPIYEEIVDDEEIL